MFKSITNEYYGDQTRWFIGTVIDVVGDPLPIPIGRVRVRIVGVHENVEVSDLPWASVMLPTTEGGLGAGFPPALQEGAQVFGVFLDGVQSQVPLVLGTIPHLLADPSVEEGDGRYASEDLVFADPGVQGILDPVAAPSESAEQTYTFFRGIGYSDAAAKGILGNIIVEGANFNPRIVSLESGGDLDGNSFGICQWRGERITGPNGLKQFAATRGMHPGNLLTQLKFIQYELDTFPVNGKAGLFKCTTPGQAAVHFMRKFERPAIFPGGGASQYPEPVWDPAGNYPAKKYGEDERISYAEGAPYSGSYYPNPVGGAQ